MPARVLLAAVLAAVLTTSALAESPLNSAGRGKWDIYYSQQDYPNARYREWNQPQVWGYYRGEGRGAWSDRWERRRAVATARRLQVGSSIEDWIDVQNAREAQVRDLYRQPPYDGYYQGRSVQPYNPEPYSPPVSSYYYDREQYQALPESGE